MKISVLRGSEIYKHIKKRKGCWSDFPDKLISIYNSIPIRSTKMKPKGATKGGKETTKKLMKK